MCSVFILPGDTASDTASDWAEGHALATHLLAVLQVHRLAIAAHTVQHACPDARPAHCLLTQLARAPVCAPT